MEQRQLYPVFELPTSYGTFEEAQRSYSPAPMFDYDAGDFVRDGAHRVVYGDGREAYREWCMKILHTRQGGALAYASMGLGGEFSPTLQNRLAYQTQYTREVTEALKQHPNTEAVRDFIFSWIADEMHVKFTVQGQNIAAFDIEMNVVTKGG